MRSRRRQPNRPAAAAALASVIGVGSAAPASTPPTPVAYTLSPELRDGALQALRVEARFRADASGETVFAWPESWGT